MHCRIPRSLASIAFALGSALFGGCILTFDDLSSGGTTGSGGATGTASSSGGATSSSSSGTGAMGGGGACPILTCDACDCPGGGCPPTVLAQADGPLGVALASDGVYWVNEHGGTIARRLEGAAQAETIATGSHPSSIALAAGFVFWSEDDGVHRCSVASCSPQMFAPSLATGSIRGIAADAQHVFWADRGAAADMGMIRSCPVGACGSPQDLFTMQFNPEGVALTTDSVVWTAQGNGQQNGSIYKGSKAGGNPSSIAAALILPTSLAVTATDVYWTESSSTGHVFRCRHDMGYCDTPADVAPMAGALGTPLDIAIAPGRVYWTNTTGGTVTSCPLPDCGGAAPTVHAGGRQSPHRLAVGSTCIFWTEDDGGGDVVKLAR